MAAPAAPGLRQLVPLPYGPFAHSRRDPLGFLTSNARRFGDVFRYQIGPFTFHLLSHPDLVKHVLQDHVANYPRSRHYRFTRAIIGDGLVSVEGDVWRRQRRMVQPAFRPDRIAPLAVAMTDAAGAMLDRWNAAYVDTGRAFDVTEEMIRLTLIIVGKALLGVELGGATDTITPAVAEALRWMDHRISNVLSAPPWVPTPRNLRFRRAMRTLDQVVYGIVAQRRTRPADSGDLLSMLLTVRDGETGAGMTDRELRDQVMTFIGAGHETTAMALTWACYLVSRHEDVRRRLRDEVAAVVGTRVPAVGDVPRLAFTRAILQETLRLYPPVAGVIRDVRSADVVGGYRVPAGSSVILSPYVTHRHPAFWDDAEAFRPDRFTPDAAANRHRFAWFPFLGGPHHCVGAEFAMMEMTLVLAMIAQRVHLELAPGAAVEAKVMLSLRPAMGVPMIATRRPLAGTLTPQES